MISRVPPSEWRRDEFGRPEWMLWFPDADLGFWYAVVPPWPVTRLSGHPCFMVRGQDWSVWAKPGLRTVRRGGAKAMPRIPPPGARAPVESAGEPDAERRRRGGQRIEEQDVKREIACDVAWRVDIEGDRRKDVARWLDPIPKREKSRDPKRSSFKKVERYLIAGRRVLHRRGVLPWLLWSDGALPRDWHRSPLFSMGFLTWYERCVVRQQRPLVEMRRMIASVREYVETADNPEDEEALGQQAVHFVRTQLGQLPRPGSDQKSEQQPDPD
jgi:hypothetical protein